MGFVTTSEIESIKNKMAKKLEWETRKVKVKDLIQLGFNPRKITDANRRKLIESLDKFNLVEIPAVNTDMQIIGGNQRVSALIMAGRQDEEIDVRYPNRKLTDKELKEYVIISNTHAGEFDFDILEAEFGDVKLDDIGFDFPVTDLDKSDEGIIAEEKEREEADYDPTLQWFLNIRCESEEHAQELYERCIAEGLDVKIVT